MAVWLLSHSSTPFSLSLSLFSLSPTEDILGQRLLGPHPGADPGPVPARGAAGDAVGHGPRAGRGAHHHHRHRHPPLQEVS